MWQTPEIKRLIHGELTDADKMALEQSITYWNDVLFTMEVMKRDAPNPIDQDLLTKIIKHLSDRKTAMEMAVTRTSIIMPGSDARMN